MMYIITEDSNSARDFWELAASVYRNPGTYTMVPLPKGSGGNTTLKNQFRNTLKIAKSGDEIFVVLDMIDNTTRFWPSDFIKMAHRRCIKLNIRFAYTKYYCFEELFVSHSELLRLSNAKYYGILDYIQKMILSGQEYFDVSNLDTQVTNFLNSINHPITNKEHFLNDLLLYSTQSIIGKFKIHKSGNAIHSSGACWIHSCKSIQRKLHPKEIESLCNTKCQYQCKNCTLKEKMEHINNHTLLKNW